MRASALILTAICLAGAAACDPAATTSSPTLAPPPAATTSTPAPVAPTPTTQQAADLPSFIGMGLQSAQDKAQAAGFYALTSHDALGRSRAQILDRDWKVCTQNPAPGQHPTNTKVDMGAVKLDETCPSTDQGAATPKAGATMPDLRGKAVAAVRDMLDRSTSFTIKDASQGRMVIVESNWQVCTQSPAPGTALNGQPVTLTVVKFSEACP